MTTNSVSASTPTTTPAVVLFGLDAQGKAHASSFTGADAALAEKAAGLMGLNLLHVGDDEGQRSLAASLPAGRIFESGKGFVPFVKRPLYEQLCALGGVPVAPPQATPKASGGRGKAAAGAGRSAPLPADPVDLPLHWSTIKPGSLVLATEGGDGAGWFECWVREDKGDDLFVLAWRDWPDEPLVLRRRDQLGLPPLNAAVATA